MFRSVTNCGINYQGHFVFLLSPLPLGSNLSNLTATHEPGPAATTTNTAAWMVFTLSTFVAAVIYLIIIVVVIDMKKNNREGTLVIVVTGSSKFLLIHGYVLLRGHSYKLFHFVFDIRVVCLNPKMNTSKI